MVDKYTPEPRIVHSTLTLQEWADRYLTLNTLGPLRDGSRSTALRVSSYKTTRGRDTAVLAEYEADIGTLHQAYWDWGAGKIQGFVPLGIPTSKKDDVLFELAGRIFVGRNVAQIDMNVAHATNALMSCLQSHVWMLTNERKTDRQLSLARAVLALLETTRAFLARHPAAMELVWNFQTDDRAEDMLQRSLAFCFFEQPWTREQMLHVLVVVLRRQAKYHGTSVFNHTLAGPIACLVLVPLLRSYLFSADTQRPHEAVVRDFNQSAQALVHHLVSILTLKRRDKRRLGPARNAAIVCSILREVPALSYLGEADVAKLLKFALDPRNNQLQPPLGQWGLLDLPSLPFRLVLGRASVAAGSSPCSAPVPHYGEDAGERSLVLCSRNSSLWSAFHLGWDLEDDGRPEPTAAYKISCMMLGSRRQLLGHGPPIAGGDQDAVLQITSGLHIVGRSRPSVSSTGHVVDPGRKNAKLGPVLDLRQPVVLVCCPRAGTLRVSQEHTGFRFEGTCDEKFLPLVAFKNAQLHVERLGTAPGAPGGPCPLGGVVATSGDGKAEAANGDDMTPMALINQLKSLAQAHHDVSG